MVDVKMVGMSWCWMLGVEVVDKKLVGVLMWWMKRWLGC